MGGGNITDGGLLAMLVLLLFSGIGRLFIQGQIDHLVGWFAHIFLVQFVMTQTLNLMCRGFQMLVWQNQNRDLVTQFNRLDIGTLLIE